MNKGRLEAFSDGVIAIIITVMVLELKIPAGGTWADLAPIVPTLFAYVLSFVLVGLYWNNHHHMLHTVSRVNGKILWANLFLLFWLSLSPFTTAWIGRSDFMPLPVAVYGFVLLMSAIGYFLLQTLIIADQGKGSRLAQAIGRDMKGKASTLCYVLAIPLSFVQPWIAIGLYVLVALIWLVPDKRIERKFEP